MLSAIYSKHATYSKKVLEMSVRDARFDHFDVVFVDGFARVKPLVTAFVNTNTLSFYDRAVFHRPDHSGIAMTYRTYHVLSSVWLMVSLPCQAGPRRAMPCRAAILAKPCPARPGLAPPSPAVPRSLLPKRRQFDPRLYFCRSQYTA